MSKQLIFNKKQAFTILGLGLAALAILAAVLAFTSPVEAQAVEALAAGPFVQVSTGRYHTCVIRNGGDVICIGDNSYGRQKRPGQVPAKR